ncbi:MULTISPECIES: sensor histidine kinase [Croceitalea]|uniref:histidine kinase n=1 Tax=Croceitalea vernalis TaxID=3075599 RepID=A0ABU3BE66_9FLAO|nr:MULTISPECIES: ATP-binding protein [unclassified Croceitalea]MDT0538616.1 ATP-binding protein [Croceitalea sp. P059]MDT0620401.1 ATP-binding protein [Croceitalea sp. P007]
MASRNFYIQLIIRVLLITATAVFMAFCITSAWYLLLVVSVIALVSQVFDLIRFINSTNRKIAYFFDAIKNEDFTLRFPERVTIKSFKELNQSLNRVNGLIQEVHLQLQIREKYYQEILKQANIGIMTFNQKGHILFSNPTLENLLNYRPLNHIKQLKQIDEKLYEVFESFKPFERKLFQLTNEREQIQLALKSTPVVLDENQLLLVVIQDINEELNEKETDSWIRLIRVLTHEIMNTITPITSISESILKYYQNSNGQVVEELDKEKIASAAKGLEVIKGQGNNLMDFVQGYRSFLNVPKPDKSFVKADEFFEKVKILMQLDADETTRIEWMIETPELEFFIDEKQLTQVLINLVKNAVHSLEDSPSGLIKVIAGLDHKNRKYIVVRDNGPGIPEEMIDEIFVPFFTTKEKGTGIGLSLSRQIIQLHGGTLKLYSNPDIETSFTLTF